jgi:hypothetical protein
MARIHGRRGRLYAGIASDTAAAEPVTFLDKYSIDFTVDKVDVTCFGESTKVYVAGIADASGSFSGFYDNATAQLFTAATDGLARKTYIYPDTSSSTTYFFGTALFDFNMSTGTAEASSVSGSWSAASAFTKVG